MPDQPDPPAASTPFDKGSGAQQPAKAIVEVFIAMNEKGDAAVGIAPGDAAQQLREDWGGNLCRIVKRTYLMSPPKILDAGELDDVPDDDGETTKVEAAIEDALWPM